MLPNNPDKTTQENHPSSSSCTKQEKVMNIIKAIKDKTFSAQEYQAMFLVHSEFSEHEQNKSSVLMWLCSFPYVSVETIQSLFVPIESISAELAYANKNDWNALDFAFQYQTPEVIIFLIHYLNTPLSKQSQIFLEQRYNNAYNSQHLDLFAQLKLIETNLSDKKLLLPKKRKACEPVEKNVPSFFQPNNKKLKREPKSVESINKEIKNSIEKGVLNASKLEQLAQMEGGNQYVFDRLVQATTTRTIGFPNSEPFLSQLQGLAKSDNISPFFAQNNIDAHKKSLLMYSVSYGLEETSKWLLSLQENPGEIIDHDGNSALYWIVISELCVSDVERTKKIINVLLQDAKDRNYRWNDFAVCYKEASEEIKLIFRQDAPALPINLDTWDIVTEALDASPPNLPSIENNIQENRPETSQETIIVDEDIEKLKKLFQEVLNCRTNAQLSILDQPEVYRLEAYEHTYSKFYELFIQLRNFIHVNKNNNDKIQLLASKLSTLEELENIQIPLNVAHENIKIISEPRNLKALLTHSKKIPGNLMQKFLKGFFHEVNGGMTYVISEYSFGREIHAIYEDYNKKSKPINDSKRSSFSALKEKYDQYTLKKIRAPHPFPWLQKLYDDIEINELKLKPADDEVEILDASSVSMKR